MHIKCKYDNGISLSVIFHRKITFLSKSPLIYRKVISNILILNILTLKTRGTILCYHHLLYIQCKASVHVWFQFHVNSANYCRALSIVHIWLLIANYIALWTAGRSLSFDIPALNRIFAGVCCNEGGKDLSNWMLLYSCEVAFGPWHSSYYANSKYQGVYSTSYCCLLNIYHISHADPRIQEMYPRLLKARNFN